MSVSIKRLGPGDEAILDVLAREDADFDLEGRGGAHAPLKQNAAQRYLASPGVLHWVALEGTQAVGFLHCSLVLLRSGVGQELLLYEVGVRQAWRRKGIGRALLGHMENWMKSNELTEVWVCADNPIAVAFYRGCGFGVEHEQPVYMTRKVEPAPKKATSTLRSFG